MCNEGIFIFGENACYFAKLESSTVNKVWQLFTKPLRRVLKEMAAILIILLLYPEALTTKDVSG